MELRKKALVTGASRGIGRGIAWAFAEAGYDLAIGHWNDAENAELTASRIRSEWGRECFVFPGNLAEAGTAAELAEQAWASLGRIDVLVNNAGITRFQGVTDLSLEVTDLLYQTNFRSPLLLMKEVSTRMIAAGISGCLLNITSSRAERAYPKDPVYGGLKAALKRAVESVAIDLAPHR
ncbi:MAG: 3-ketoacyl-ACP reductase, partial [Paenibacillus sp.]|nr:3-ketoacyl-ACP reductase [Paenibacillus sp.]